MPEVLDRTKVFSTHWFSVIAKSLDTTPEPYYTLELPDYVAIVALTRDGKVILVRQYRPAVETYTLELPSGHVDPGEEPAAAIKRELLEETGYQADHVEFLGHFLSDSGRLSNKMWCYYATNVTPTTPPGEEGIELVLCSQGELVRMVTAGLINPGLHLGAILLAILNSSLKMTETHTHTHTYIGTPDATNHKW